MAPGSEDAPPRLADRLRREVLLQERPDGGLALLDPLTDRLLELSPRARRGLDRGDRLVELELARAGLLEDPAAEALRARAFAARTREKPAPVRAGAPVEADWALAEGLPDAIAAPWRDPERWRRLAEDGAAGRRYLLLPGLVARDAARAIGEAVEALPWARLETDLVKAHRRLLAGDEVRAWRDLMESAPLRALMGAALGRALPAGTVVNAWRLGAGDHMGVHPDGPQYHGTLSLGLCEGWTASQGGAIAFGEPSPGGGFAVSDRFLPHLGDACLFAPANDTWHCVEPVTAGTRRSLTGWWVEPEHAL
ncbi:MAG: 2OG-Fe(II) oxygenase [Deltaproteobacteria bacterium]|nr:2OG-Fe(II) oxygenase [Deltaproteobacteria bacterium]